MRAIRVDLAIAIPRRLSGRYRVSEVRLHTVSTLTDMITNPLISVNKWLVMRYLKIVLTVRAQKFLADLTRWRVSHNRDDIS